MSVIAVTQSCSSFYLPAEEWLGCRLSRPRANVCKFPAHVNYAFPTFSSFLFLLRVSRLKMALIIWRTLLQRHSFVYKQQMTTNDSVCRPMHHHQSRQQILFLQQMEFVVIGSNGGEYQCGIQVTSSVKDSRIQTGLPLYSYRTLGLNSESSPWSQDVVRTEASSGGS